MPPFAAIGEVQDREIAVMLTNCGITDTGSFGGVVEISKRYDPTVKVNSCAIPSRLSVHVDATKTRRRSASKDRYVPYLSRPIRQS